MTPEELQSFVHLPAGETAMSLSSLEGGTSSRGFTLTSVDGEGGIRGEVSSNLVRLVAVPKMEKALEEEHGPASRPPRFVDGEDVRARLPRGRTGLLLCAATVAEMRRYAGLLSTV